MVVVKFLTRNRVVPNLASRAPSGGRSAKEVFGLVAYGVIVQIVGALLGKMLGWHPISFHLAGTLYGAGDMVVAPREAFGWMSYNFVFYAYPLPLFQVQKTIFE